jgi:3-isopropylmalate/(R)-2-methylmalate dehydratase small subunit
MENIDRDFSKRIQTGDIIVATSNFGCGSSREFAPLAIKGAGVSCVIAKSFARIFFRNAINIGLPLLECAEAVENTETGDTIQIDLSSGKIRNLTKDMVFRAISYPDFVRELITAGGLIEYAKKKLGGNCT